MQREHNAAEKDSAVPNYIVPVALMQMLVTTAARLVQALVWVDLE